jgi:large subunit ribosomal protein L34
MQPAYRPHKLKRVRKLGFRAKMADRWGRATLSRRRARGRKRLTTV